MQPAGSSPDWNEQGGVPGKGRPVRRREKAAEPEDEPPEESRADAGRAFVPLLHDAACRLAAAEIRGLSARAGKASSDRAKWRAWLVTFYDNHADYAAKTLAPLAHAWKLAGKPEADASRFVAETIASAVALADADMPAILADWETTREPQVFDMIAKTFGLELEEEPCTT
jgi:hypothetical protein